LPKKQWQPRWDKVCPVKINIREQIYARREVMEEKRQIPLVKKEAMGVAAEVLSHPDLYRIAASSAEASLKTLPHFALYNLNAWGRHRDVPQPAKETFHEWYRRNRSAAGGREANR
jgi:L-lactate dehydrogenase complex protein LldF